ncbi:MAG: OmpA family protein [Acetobacteraceae bacterium]|nr:OmpA family protein [Acetobacteraceae bacterium]
MAVGTRAFVCLTLGFMAAPLTVFAQAPGNPSEEEILQKLSRCPPGAVCRGIHLGPAQQTIPDAPEAAVSPPTMPTAAEPAAPPTSATPPNSGGRQTAAVPIRLAPPASTPGTVNLQVEFRTASTDLTAAAMKTLDSLGRALQHPELAGDRFRIEGHTDTVGSPTYNKLLSERRAAAVAGYVSEKFGIERSRLEAVGMGEEGLAVPTPPQTPEPRNRRVQITNLGA